VKPELEKLVELQIADNKIRGLQTAINTIDERRGRLETDFEARAFEIRELEKSRDEARIERNKLEAHITESKTKLEAAERKLSAAQNQKEYEAAIREKGAFSKQIAELTTKFEEKNNTYNEAEAKLQERADEIATLESERAKAFADFEAENKDNLAQIETEKKRRQEIFAALPKNVAAIYDRLVKRIRDGVAVVEVKNGACTACSMNLRPQLFVDVKVGGKIIHCESCARILYYMPTDAEVATAK
jgi:predicted  nucleic acid-binding Zn-ribbon protein